MKAWKDLTEEERADFYRELAEIFAVGLAAGVVVTVFVLTGVIDAPKL